jgi:hypothetical protein
VDERRILEMRKGRRMTVSRKLEVVIVIVACGDYYFCAVFFSHFSINITLINQRRSE